MQTMIKMIRFASPILLLLLIAFTRCDSGGPTARSDKPVQDIAAEKEEIKSTLTDMWDAIENGDIERYASYIHPDFTQFGETAKVLRVGKEAEVRAIREWVEEPTTVHTEMKEPRVKVNGDVAWITYYWSDSGKSKGEPFATKGKSTRIFVKEDGKWLCIHGHYTLLEE